jgi:hypothetical protein
VSSCLSSFEPRILCRAAAAPLSVRGRRTICVVLALGIAAADAQAQEAPAPVRTEPAALVQPVAESCRDCHRAEYAVWAQSQHAKGFSALHRSPLAQSIADSMGEQLIKRDSLCLECHYTAISTANADGSHLQAGQGVSCQSCHGAAREWINVHYDFGVDGEDLASARLRETTQHRLQRRAQSQSAGMITGSDIRAMVAVCFQCHYIANEALLTQSHHPAGNPSFEFVSWSQSRIRHSFLESTLSDDAPVHALRSIERQRLMYVAGRMLALEYSVRALAQARRFGRYTKTFQTRVEEAIEHLNRIVEATDSLEVAKALNAVADLRFVPDNAAALLRAAEEIATASAAFVDTNTGAGLQRIDPLIAAAAEELPLLSRLCSADECAQNASNPDDASR